jgi:hypothetical protein
MRKRTLATVVFVAACALLPIVGAVAEQQRAPRRGPDAEVEIAKMLDIVAMNRLHRRLACVCV